VPLVVVLVPRVIEVSSPELLRRATPPHRAWRRLRRVQADCGALDESAALRAISRWNLCTKSSTPARSRAEPRRRTRRQLPPLAVRSPPPARLRATIAARSGSDASDRSNRRQPPPLAPAAAASR
jgi:hypothetical protein